MTPEKPHLITFDPHGEFGPEVRCWCGWRKRHARAKVRDRAAAGHLAAFTPSDGCEFKIRQWVRAGHESGRGA